MTKIKYGASDIELSMSDKIVLSCCGDVIFEREVEQLNYSHFEVINGFCLIYFSGKRDFVIVLKDKEIIFSDYYDEYNVNENERLFMVRLFDSLNHGKVLRIDGKDFETYLVYLDDNDLELKRDFVSHVFLDCVKAGNLKYANNLLCDNLKMEQVNLIQKFFPDFDYFYPIGQNEFVLTNKKALAGIFEFELINDKISNINCR